MWVDDLKQLQKELKSITQHLDLLKKINCAKPEAPGEMEIILKKLAPGETFGSALKEWKEKTQITLEKIQKERKESFDRNLAEFIRAVQAANTYTREFSQSWRVGPLEVQLRREYSQAQLAYNQQIISTWVPIASFDDLKKLYEGGMGKLNQAAQPINILGEVLWNAYDYLKYQQMKANSPHPEIVPLKSFCNEYFLSMTRYMRSAKKAIPKEYPNWVFLYNLDLYYERISEVPKEKRLGLVAGTQSQTKSWGMVTNGLNAEYDYKSYCYIKAAEIQ